MSVSYQVVVMKMLGEIGGRLKNKGMLNDGCDVHITLSEDDPTINVPIKSHDMVIFI